MTRILFNLLKVCIVLMWFLPAVDQDKIHQIVEEERALKEENVRLQRRLQREKQRREELSRQLSESESSLEMEDERCGMFFSCVFV